MKSMQHLLYCCSIWFSILRYHDPHNEIVASYLIGQLAEKFPLAQVKSKNLLFDAIST